MKRLLTGARSLKTGFKCLLFDNDNYLLTHKYASKIYVNAPKFVHFVIRKTPIWMAQYFDLARFLINYAMECFMKENKIDGISFHWFKPFEK